MDYGKFINTFIKTMILIGIAQGISTWLYLVFLPKTFFFVTIFGHKDFGMCLTVFIAYMFNIQDTFINKILNPLFALIVANIFYRLEVMHLHHLACDVNKVNCYMSLFLFCIPFAMFWAFANLMRRSCIDWTYEKNK